MAGPLRLPPFNVSYLVIAGGGSGGRSLSGANDYGGGAGAGGYRCNVVGENSGGGASAEAALLVPFGSYIVTVGAGGSSADAFNWTSGNNSVFSSIASIGGGWGGGLTGTPAWRNAAVGGSGGAGGEGSSAAAGTTNQGFTGAAAGGGAGGGGGGAGGAGGVGASNVGGAGGIGVSSSITGSAVGRGGGGAGWGPSASAGATDGGGTHFTGGGVANTGGGGGAGGGTAGGNGGSGVVIFRAPAEVSVTFSAGVTQTNTLVGTNRVYVITATSTTSETVTIA